MKPASCASARWNGKAGVTDFLYDAFGARVLKRTGGTTTITHPRRRLPKSRDLHVMSVGGLAEIHINGAAGTRETFYQHSNYRGDTIAVSDEYGNVVERRAYSPFGRRLDNSHRPTDAPLPMSGSFFGFTGHEHDDELGLINMRGRVFDPASSTFLTQDPIVSRPLHGPAWNGYSYVEHAPTQFVDPTGFQGVTWIGSPPDGPSVADRQAGSGGARVDAKPRRTYRAC